MCEVKLRGDNEKTRRLANVIHLPMHRSVPSRRQISRGVSALNAARRSHSKQCRSPRRPARRAVLRMTSRLLRKRRQPLVAA